MKRTLGIVPRELRVGPRQGSAPVPWPPSRPMSQVCYSRSMSEVASRELRNRTRALLARVAAGEQVTITVDGIPVARLVPPEQRPRWMRREAFARLVLRHQADPGLRSDIAGLAPDTTDDVPL